MTEPPTLDDRSQEELVGELTELADSYVDGWESSSTDVASLLLRIAAEFGGETIQQLNRLPEKHRAAFLDSLGFQRRPPQAARLPLSVDVSADLDRNVSVPSGTQAVAATADDETAVFEIPQEGGFEATPASPMAWYTVNPETDRLVSHEAAIDGDSQRLFAGPNHQHHALYFGDGSVLELDPGSIIEIELRGSVDPQVLEACLCWEYYGVDEDGGEGWHSLPTDTAATADRSAIADGDAGESLRHRLDRLSTRQQSTDEGYSVCLRLPNEFVSTTIDGIESRWIRCRVDTSSSAPFATQIESVRVLVGQSPERDRLTPDAGFTDDVPLSFGDDSDIRPLGRLPQPSSTFYLTASEPLSKPGALVTLSFESPVADSSTDSASAPSEPNGSADGDSSGVDFGVLGGPPELSWEYWNGTSWTGLPVQSDDTDSLRAAGTLQFVVPDDIAPTAVSGHEARWIRGRLVSGSYGQPSVDVTDPDSGGFDSTDSPQYGGISLRYEHTDSSFAHVVTENNGVRESVPETADRFQPFERLSEGSQTIYLGFDGVLRDGPIPVFVPLADPGYPRGFDPGVQWEYCTDPETDSWSRLPVDDGTCGFTESGIVSLRFPEPTVEHERFGTRCHWVRAVVTEDRFVTERGESHQSAPTAGSRSPRSDARPPVVGGLHPNTQWADNARTIEDETLGTSDGSADQQFDCAYGPLIDCEVWVDEADSLSAAERADLQETQPDRVAAITDDQGELTAFWVRWTPVDNFVGVDSDSRVYRPDRSAGTISFGDGDAGAIPPHGNAVRATYTTGGGPAGNVESGAVMDLKTPISLVESVDNPAPADGGIGVEPTEQVATRAAGELKTRGRAVTASDFEQVAATAVRKLATVECQPHLGPDGTRQPGWITLLIVPDSNDDRPMPSMALEQRVERAVSEAAPARITAGEGSGITVRGPNYAPVSVEATVQTTGDTSLSVLKSELESTLDCYLHPLDGDGGTGWAFGDLPTTASLQSHLSSVAGVEAVTELSATVQQGGNRHRLTRGSPTPELSLDGLVCSGEHTISVQLGGRQ
ncbi:MAG: baseplate J/gp47 family protein [Euryarchaeota archaeon]|nr:baseplate J/gp47 family protein [Euryarchaeota archaeon]